MSGSGRKGKSLINTNQRGVTTRSRTKQLTQSKYCDGNCAKSPEISRKELDSPYMYKTVDQSGEVTQDLANQEDILGTMAVEKQLQEIRDLLAKRHDQLGDTLTGMQAALEKVPSDSSHVSEAKLEKFAGYESHYVNRWILKCNNRLALRRPTLDSQAAAADLSFYLSGPAEIWYFSLPAEVREDITKLRDALLNRFSNSDFEWRLRQDLSSRKQDENESLDSYVDFVSSTCI